jgi:tetratricopeptide (TPR) repeat protein
MRRKDFSSALIISFLILTLVSCGRFQARMLVRQGNDLYSGRKYEEAISKYKEALQKDPSLGEIYLNIGLSYMGLYVPGSTHPKDKEYADQAIKAFRQYLKYRPDDQNVNGYLVQMYLNSDRKEDAIGYFEEYLKKHPTDVAIMQKLAFLYAQSGKFDEALNWYRKRASVEPNNAEAYYIIGVICWEKVYKFPDTPPDQKQNLINTGMDALQKATQINSSYADAYLYQNLMYREKAKLISLDPNAVPEDKVDEYNSYLQKAKELQDKAIELRKKQPAG